MKLLIKKIKLDELEAFVGSKTFQQLEYIPISPIRAKSYLANPNALPSDTVLYLGFIENKLVAFRSLLPDVLSNYVNEIRFAWCSGSWVHPSFRRLGFSELLLKDAYHDWDKKLMFTNYAPNSENLYLKSGLFKPVHQFNGVRAYLFPKTKKLVSKANSNFLYQTLFFLVDGIISFYSSVRSHMFTYKVSSSLKFKTTEFPDEQCFGVINQDKFVFRRNKPELKWIFNNPWISLQKSKQNKSYPFSSCASEFYYKTVKAFSEDNFIGFFIFSVREGHLKTLYWQLPNGLETEAAIFLKEFCTKNKIERLTVYKKEVADRLFKRKFPFLHVKKYGQKIYSTFQVHENSGRNFQDGDGDVIFT